MLTRMPIVVEDASTSQRRFRCTERSHFHARYLAKKNKQREREREREREMQRYNTRTCSLLRAEGRLNGCFSRVLHGRPAMVFAMGKRRHVRALYARSVRGDTHDLHGMVAPFTAPAGRLIQFSKRAPLRRDCSPDDATAPPRCNMTNKDVSPTSKLNVSLAYLPLDVPVGPQRARSSQKLAHGRV